MLFVFNSIPARNIFRVPRRVHQRLMPFREQMECHGYGQIRSLLPGFLVHNPIVKRK